MDIELNEAADIAPKNAQQNGFELHKNWTTHLTKSTPEYRTAGLKNTNPSLITENASLITPSSILEKQKLKLIQKIDAKPPPHIILTCSNYNIIRNSFPEIINVSSIIQSLLKTFGIDKTNKIKEFVRAVKILI